MSNNFYILTSDGWKSPTGAEANLSRVIAQNSSAQSFASGSTFVTVTGWTELADTSASFDPVTGIFTVPTDGFYLWTAALFFVTVAQNSPILVAGTVNDAIPARIQSVYTASSTGGAGNSVTANFAGVVQLSKNDVCKLTVTQSSGAPLVLSGSYPNNYFTIAQV